MASNSVKSLPCDTKHWQCFPSSPGTGSPKELTSHLGQQILVPFPSKSGKSLCFRAAISWQETYFFTSSHCLQNCFKGFCPRNFTENNAPTFLGLINFHLFAVPHLSIWILKGGRRTISFEQNVQESMGIIKSTYRIIQASNRTWLLHWHSCHWLEQKIHSESFPASLRYNSCCSKHDAKSDPSHAMPMLLMQ